MFAARTDPQRSWLDQHHLKSNPFGSFTPADGSSGDWSGYMVDPDNLVGALQQLGEICLVFGGQGSGKSLFCTALADDCWPARPNARRAALPFRQSALLGMAERCRAQGRLPDQLDFIASAAFEMYGLVENEDRPLAGSAAQHAAAQWDALHSACTAALQRPAPGRLSADRLRDLLLEWLAALGLRQLLVLVDEIDEAAAALDGEPDAYFSLVRAVVERPAVWRGHEFCCIAFLSAECRDVLEAQPFYPGRVRTRAIEWDAETLVQMLDQRVITYSEAAAAAGFHDLLALDLRSAIDAPLCELAAQRPDWALEIATQLIEAHCRGSKAAPLRHIGRASWQSVQTAWQRERRRRMLPLQRLQRLCGAAGDAPLALAAESEPAALPPRLEIDETTGNVRLGGRLVNIGERPYRVLLYLYRHEGRLCQYIDLMAEAWPQENPDGVSMDALTAAVKRLRDALGDIAPGVTYIENLSKRGFVLWVAGKPESDR